VPPSIQCTEPNMYHSLPLSTVSEKWMPGKKALRNI